MNTTMKLLFAGAIFASAILSACKKDNDPDTNDNNNADLVLLGSDYTDSGGMLVTLYAEDSLYSQYTKLFIQVQDSDSKEVIENATVTLMPMMDMGSMQHSAPYENPTGNAGDDGLFEAAVVFQMPGEMGWTLDVNVDNLAGGVGSVTIPLSVKNPAVTRTHVITPENGDEKLVISYLEPSSPEVGINDFEITLHYKESMMSFPARDSYTVEIDPQMPSMGHGSPNNVNPTHTADGHYEGKVNFTMTGLWRINLNIMNGSEVVDTSSYFEVSFQ